MNKKGKLNRKKLIINPTLQKRLIKDVCFWPAIGLIVSILVLAGGILWSLHAGPGSEGVELTTTYALVLGMMGLNLLLASFITIRSAFLISNRVAGPLYRLQKAMKQVENGDSNFVLKFRKGDYLEETAEWFNSLLAYIESVKKEHSNKECVCSQQCDE